MNYPIWELPSSGLLIALVAVLHVFVSHFAVGGGLFLVLAERKARREDDRALLGYVRRHSRFFILLTLVFGAITGVGIWFTITLVHPAATSSLISTFVWGWAIEWTFFVIEVAAAMIYYYGWDRMPARAHMAVGWIYFAAAWLSLVVINGILSYMLTPGRWLITRGFWDGFFNPTYLPSTIARTFAAAGLAGLYAIFTAAFLEDAALKRKVARWAGLYWVLPMAIALPLSLAWYFSAAASAGIPVDEILGSASAGFGSIVASSLGPLPAAGQPYAQRAVRVGLAAMALALIVTLYVVFLRRDRYGRSSAALLLACGLFSIGGAEWLRETLRKPYVIGNHMFVNGVRLPAAGTAPRPPAAWGEDAFTIVALNETGVLPAARFTRLPGGHAPGEAAAGREIFRLECSACHSVGHYNAVRPLVRGQSSSTLEGTIRRLARPVNRSGEPTSWNDPELRLQTWRGRRMPPFVGTDAEARALAVYLATLGGGDVAPPPEPAAAPKGATVFENNCAMCHAAEGDYPIARMIRGRDAGAMYEVIGRLPQLNEAMPPFEGSDEERRALAEHLAAIGQASGNR